MPKDQKPTLPLIAPDSVAPERLAAAFAEIEPSLSKLQRDMLSAMYHAADHSLMIDGDGQYSKIINAFGKVGGRLSRQLGFQPERGYHLLWIAYQGPGKDGTMAWRMRENFAKALGIFGW